MVNKEMQPVNHLHLVPATPSLLAIIVPVPEGQWPLSQAGRNGEDCGGCNRFRSGPRCCRASGFFFFMGVPMRLFLILPILLLCACQPGQPKRLGGDIADQATAVAGTTSQVTFTVHGGSPDAHGYVGYWIMSFDGALIDAGASIGTLSITRAVTGAQTARFVPYGQYVVSEFVGASYSGNTATVTPTGQSMVVTVVLAPMGGG